MIICRSVTRVEVEASTDGTVFIVQGEEGSEDPTIIEITMEHIEAMVRALRECKRELAGV